MKFMTFCILRYLGIGKQLCDNLLLFLYSNSTLSALEEYSNANDQMWIKTNLTNFEFGLT